MNAPNPNPGSLDLCACECHLPNTVVFCSCFTSCCPTPQLKGESRAYTPEQRKAAGDAMYEKLLLPPLPVRYPVLTAEMIVGRSPPSEIDSLLKNIEQSISFEIKVTGQGKDLPNLSNRELPRKKSLWKKLLLLIGLGLIGCAHAPPPVHKLLPDEVMPLPVPHDEFSRFQYGIIGLHACSAQDCKKPFPTETGDMLLCTPNFNSAGQITGLGCTDWSKFLKWLKAAQDKEKQDLLKKQAPIGPPAEI